MTFRVHVGGVGLLGPGLPGWVSSREYLSGARRYLPADVALPAPEALPPAERRRTSQSVRLALAVGGQALERIEPQSAPSIPTVFTSSGGDGVIIHELCEALARTEREISPTRFHNSVHNAPAGYWSIAQRSHSPSTSLCGFDWSFAAGILEAAAQLAAGQRAVLLVSYDLPYPQPLGRARPILGVLGAALLLTRDAEAFSVASLELALESRPREATRADQAELEALRSGNPTGRALPLLIALAKHSSASLALDYFETGTLALELEPLRERHADA